MRIASGGIPGLTVIWKKSLAASAEVLEEGREEDEGVVDEEEVPL